MESQPTCPCGKPLPPRHRKYCAEHSSVASVLWKRAQRRACHGTPYWLDYWLKRAGDGQSAEDVYNAYMREYMRRYRRRPRMSGEQASAIRTQAISERPDIGRADVEEVSYAQ